MRNASMAVLREKSASKPAAVRRFAVNPAIKDTIVIEMNPRLPLLGAGVESHQLPDCQSGRQTGGCTLTS